LGKSVILDERKKTVEIVINGKKEFLDGEITLSDFLKHKKLAPDTVVVEHNLTIVSNDEYDSTLVRDKDRLEILRFVGGG
jgi:sulfur carrier protein